MTETVLVISAIGLPPQSARGVKQTLAHIDAAANYRRDVNGTLFNLAQAQFEKYRTTIECQDMEAPALAGVWPGVTITVECVAELPRLTGASPERTMVSGSEYVKGLYTIGRPILTMMVTAFETETDELPADVAWRIEAEEV